MEFLSTVSLDATSGEMVVWNALKEALRPDEGFAFLRYPIFPAGEDSSYRYEPGDRGVLVGVIDTPESTDRTRTSPRTSTRR